MKKDKYSMGWLAVVVFCSIIACFYLYIHKLGELSTFSYIPNSDILTKTGMLGDSAGLFNALFSGLAFGGVILTIIWQINNDNKNRKVDNKTQFENIFFNMTQTFEYIIEGLTIEQHENSNLDSDAEFLVNHYGPTTASNDTIEPVKDVKGRAIFKHIYMARKVDRKQMIVSIRESGIIAYENLMDGILDHYFRYLYRILKFIDDTELIGEQEKYKYVSIFRAQLSEYELIMIYYNGLSKFGSEKLKPLIEKYSILKNIRYADLANPNEVAEKRENANATYKYADSAYEHTLVYVGNWIQILVNSAFFSFVLILLLYLLKPIVNNLLFAEILSKSIFKNHPLPIIMMLLVIILYYSLQIFFCNKKICVKRISYLSRWEDVRYVLSCYYNAEELQLVVPILASFFYLCGEHQWYGYGFISYALLLILWLAVKPVIGVGFMIREFLHR